nr:golgin candidate 5 [Tanacetum cinerariifolium]
MAFISSAKHNSGNKKVNTASVPLLALMFPLLVLILELPVSAKTLLVLTLLLNPVKKTWKKISIQGTDVAGFDKSKVECFNCHKIGHFAWECRAPRSQDRGMRDNYRQGSKVEEQAPKELMAIDGDDTVTGYSRPSPAIESTSDNAKNKNPSVTETEALPSTISPKPFIKFVKANDSPTKSKTDKVETAKKAPVKYAEQYRKPTKKPNVRGNQRNCNNLKSHQLGPNFMMKKKACFNYGNFNHLAYDCSKRVKNGTSRSQNNTHKSFTPRPAIHKPYRPPMRPMRSNMNVARPNRTSFHKLAHSYNKRPIQRTSTNFSTVNRKFSTANRKFPTGSTKFFTADMGKKGNVVKALAWQFPEQH